MKKLLYPLLFLASFNCYAQIPNASFESWTGGNPDGWLTGNNPPMIVMVSQDATAYDGASSAKYEVENVSGFPVSAPFISGSADTEGYFPVSSRHGSVHGWVITSFAGSDHLRILVGARKMGANAGSGILHIYANSGTWTEFAVPITYLDGTIVPDSMVIDFSFVGSPGPVDYHIGSYVLIDDLTFGGVVGAQAPVDNAPSWKVFPNPCAGDFTMLSPGPFAAETALRIYDASLRLVSKMSLPGGTEMAELSLKGEAAGIYMIEIRQGDQREYLKLMKE